MAHYAYVDGRNIVTQVIVGKDENEPVPDGYNSWEHYYGALRCSYNTYGGEHKNGGVPFRKNYPGLGFIWDPIRDAFIPPRPYLTPSWVLNEDTCLWEAPVPYPNDGQPYTWDESTLSWILVANPMET